MIKKLLNKKFCISILVMLLLLSTFVTLKTFATEEELNNPIFTIISAEHDPAHEVNDGRYIPFANLRDYYDYFCCYHGGIYAHIPSAKDVILKTEQGEVSEGYLTQNDIGKKNFEVTLDGENPESPFKQVLYKNQSYGFYRVKVQKHVDQKEAYILAEMMENLPSLAEAEYSGTWAAEEQHAWWTTTAGSHGAIEQPLNDLAIEAEAFRDYIVEAAGVSNEDEVTRTTTIDYEFNGQKKSLDCGFDIKYEPRFYDGSEEDVNKDNKVDAFDQVTVAWDADKQVYKIGPFALDYIEASTQVGDRPEVMFAGIKDAKLYTDADSEPLVRGEDWRFLWTNNRADSEFPHTDEEFYIELDYIEGATQVTDLVFEFKYMNAAGKYEYLEGKYFQAYWTPKDKENICQGGSTCRHGRTSAHDYISGYDADNQAIISHCSGGTPCSHGKFSKHVESKDFWVELQYLEENKAQLLALGLCAARVEFNTELHYNIELENTGKLRIHKELVDEDGEVIDSNRRFQFKIYIDGEYRETVSVPANKTLTRTYTWEAGEDAPSYEVVEVETDDYEIVSIENATGTLSSENTVSVNVKNKEKSEEHHGSLKLDKIVIGDIKDKEYEFKVVIGRDLYNVKLSENTGWTWTSPEYTWKDDNAPKYTVQEINIPDGVELIGITPSTGYLVDNDETSQVTVKAINEGTDIHHKGSLKLDKVVIGNIKDKEYHFKVTIGNDVHDVVISEKTGWTWESKVYEWDNDNAPTYKVEEVNIPDGVELVGITPSTGKLVDSDETSQVTVTAVNSEKGPEYEYGNVKITKRIEGDATTTDTFKFKLTVDGETSGHQEIIVELKAGETYTSDNFKWEKGKTPCTYKVEEIDIPDGATLVGIENATGTLGNGKIAEVIAINELEERSGKIKVTKQIVTDDKLQDEAVEGTFTVSVKISGTFEMNGESIVNGTRTITNQLKAGESFETPEIKWYGNNAPTYTITETDMPAGWNLVSISSPTGTLDEGTIDITVLNEYRVKVVIDLTFEMAGDVWEDGPLNEDDKNTENSVANGIYDRGIENPIDGVEVKIWWVPYKGDVAQMDARREATGYLDLDKTPISFPLITGEDTEPGHWIAKRMPVAAVTDEEKVFQGYTSARYYVEFTYDGQTYEPTEFLASGTRDEFFSGKADSTSSTPSANVREKYLNDSMALDENREEVNNRIAEVKGDTPIDEVTGITNGKVVGTDGTEYDIRYNSRDNININRKISEVVTRDPGSNRPLDPFKASATTAMGNLFYPFDDKVHLEGYDKIITELNEVVQIYYYSATYPYTQHINLGLVKREDADLSAVKDIVSVKVAVNGKVVEYTYNKLLDKFTEATPTDNQIVTAQNEVTGYNLDLYSSDYYYRTAVYKEANPELYNDLNNSYKDMGLESVEDREMDIYIKYRINLYNTSEGGYDAEINEVLDYYDESFELVTTEVKKYVQTETDGGLKEELVTVAVPSTYNGTNPVTWSLSNETVTDVNGEKYKVMSTNSLDGYKIKAGEKATIDVTFKVTKSTDSNNVQDSIKIEGVDKAKSNIVEISNYSTYYKDSDKIAGKIDKDSAPDNVNLNVEKDGEMEAWFEDDTAAAPKLNIELVAAEEARSIDGMVWEDKEEVKVDESYNEYVGNGVYDEGEKKLGDVPTELHEKVTVKHYDEAGTVQKDEAGNDIYKEYDVLWPTETPLDVLGGQTVSQVTGFSSTTTTSPASETEGQYNFENVPAGNFVVNFTYGNDLLSQAPTSDTIKVFNGHDYKTTSYQTGFESVNENGITNNEWHDLENTELQEQRVSDARDIETRRLEVIEKTKVMTNVNGEILDTANMEPVLDATGKDTVHEELFNNFYMNAETAKLNLEIEKTEGNSISGIVVDGNVEGQEKVVKNYEIKNIDVGLEERSENEIVLDKEISRIKLTTNDGATILDALYDIKYEPKVDSRTGETTWKADVKLNKESSIGIDQLQALNKDEENGLQNFRYINIDDNILQGTTITMEYAFTALNIGEVDLIGEKLENFKTAEEIEAAKVALEKAVTEYTKSADGKFTRNNLVGEYLGSTYYNGASEIENKDVVSTVKVRQLIDYVDNDATFAAKNNMTLDQSWRAVTEPELLGKLDEATGEYNERIISTTNGIFSETDGNIDVSIGSILDDKKVKYNTENKNNIILSIENDEAIDEANPNKNDLKNTGFMKKLVPFAAFNEDENSYETQMKLVTSRVAGADTSSEDMTFDNIAEIVKFESSVGKRDIEAVPGNTNPSEGEFKASLEERDTSATELITLTPPTGANLNKVLGIQLILVISAGLAIIAIGIIVIKKKVLTK